MRALRSFTVRVSLPPALGPLEELATNLRWSWDERTRDLFRWCDPAVWEEVGHDPVRLLSLLTPERLGALAGDSAFLAFLTEVRTDLRRYLDAPAWYQRRRAPAGSGIAYFSPEFGIAEAVPQYSGGLGVLAGDHLKAASGLGLPLVGVGLLYRQGYFRQALSPDGWQTEVYPRLDPHAMAVRPVEGVTVTVELAQAPLVAQVWRADVGRVRLYLLDSDVDENDPYGRLVTDRLYGGDTEHRLRQEILLGIGGVRALAAVGEDIEVFHTNEGHAGFLGLERIRRLVTAEGLSFNEALEASRAGAVFTTHTPVPAGIDRFPRSSIERHFSLWCEECGVSIETLMELGHLPGESPGAPFNMAVMGLRLAGRSNAVSKLHGRVSRAMFAPLWPAIEVDEVPIESVTNGVHAPTWVSPEINDLVTRAVLPNWGQAEAEDWARVDAISDDQLWRAREQGRERLVGVVRGRLRASMASSEPETPWWEDALDPRVLTIGWARRFAAYKRAPLLLSDPERLIALLTSADCPVQMVFAGKAHPADDPGKSMIRQLVQFSRETGVRHRIAFLEDYDIGLARSMYQGCDVWLNTPRRPLEACGTSGMKSALNGGLNCSILDGWWDERFNGDNGWAIASAEGYEDPSRRDAVEASSLFDLLERQIVPLFYERIGGLPRAWVRRVKASLRSLGPSVEASRMVRDYTERFYDPAAQRGAALAGDGYRRARELAAWKARVRNAWPQVRVDWVEADGISVDLGSKRTVEAVVWLGSLGPADVVVQLVHGTVGGNEELTHLEVVDMAPVPPGSPPVPPVSPGADFPSDPSHPDGPATAPPPVAPAPAPTEAPQEGWLYRGTFACTSSGRYGFTVRVLPSHEDLVSPVEMGLAAWA
ncbi:MAG: alpha-glucan family phosphorylase [Acidimicrobiales bacterium]